MKIEFDSRNAEVIGSNCSVGEIAEALKNLRSSGLNERYDIYSELFREDWATNAGYVLLPAMFKSLRGSNDEIDLEVAFVVGSIQSSVLRDSKLGDFAPIVAPFVEAECLEKTIQQLKAGNRFCGPNLPAEQCESLIALLRSFATPDSPASAPRG